MTKCNRWTCYEAEIMPKMIPELVKAVDEEMVWLLQAMPEQPGRITNREVLQTHLRSLEESGSRKLPKPSLTRRYPVMKKLWKKRLKTWRRKSSKSEDGWMPSSVAEREGGIESIPGLVGKDSSATRDGSARTAPAQPRGMDRLCFDATRKAVGIVTTLHKFAMRGGFRRKREIRPRANGYRPFLASRAIRANCGLCSSG